MPPPAVAASAALAQPDASNARADLLRSAVIIGAAVFSTTLSQTKQMLLLPLQHLLKEELHVTQTAMASFFALASLAWYLKPAAGLLTDCFPLLGTRRRGYLLVALAGGAALGVGLAAVPRTYASLLAALIAMNACMVVGSTVAGGLMVEAGNRLDATGRLSSARLAVMYSCLIFSGPIGGYLASRDFSVAALATAVVVFLAWPVTYLQLPEAPAPRAELRLAQVWLPLKELLRSRLLWAAMAICFLVEIAPGFFTTLYFYRTNTLHFTDQFIGYLRMSMGVGGMVGAALYGLLCRRLRLRYLLALCIVIVGVSSLGYLAYRSDWTAFIVDGLYGLGSAMASAALLDVATRATPVGAEALGFSLVISVQNIASSSSDVLGAKLMDSLHLSFHGLVWINALTSLLTLAAVPLLPGALMNRRDGAAS